jgi:radical SAM protein with 4Fe4S-binding SPASM domain
MTTGLYRVSYGNLKNIIAEKIYNITSIDLTRPTQVFAIINKRCVSRCVMCDSWQVKDPPELDASVWIRFLADMKKFNPYFSINFTGGEPLCKKDFLDVLEFCSREGIMAGFTTNGFLLTPPVVDHLMRMKLFNIHVSIDSLRAEVHDRARGIPGALKLVQRNLDHLLEQKAALKNKTAIIIKTNVFNENLDDLEGVAAYCREKGLNGLIFQPILKWTPCAEEMFRVDQAKLQHTISRLIAMKRAGYPILDSESQLNAWSDHFNDRPSKRNGHCPVALRDLSIEPDGRMMLCDMVESTIGNIREERIAKLWHSERVRKLRKTLQGCTGPCTSASVVKRTFREYLELFRRLASGR